MTLKKALVVLLLIALVLGYRRYRLGQALPPASQ
jgi:hypothetical protein